MTTKTEQLEYLRCSKLGFCQRCKLAETGRNKIVFGSGNSEANIMIISGAPGERADITGEPFTDRSGRLLNKLLQHGGTSRDAVYITHIVKCRPPGRDPQPNEIVECLPYLHAQIGIIKPTIILTMGEIAGNLVVNNSPHLTMQSLQDGSWLYKKADFQIPVVCIPHPEWLLKKTSPIAGEVPKQGREAYNKAVKQVRQAVAFAEPLIIDL